MCNKNNDNNNNQGRKISGKKFSAWFQLTVSRINILS